MSNRLSPKTTAIVQLLGKLDALFWPRRGEFRLEVAQVRYCLRRDWSTRGLPVRGTAADGADRKALERLWDSLVAAGLVQIHGPAGRRTHARLTFHGEQTARCLAATGNVIDDWAYFEAIVETFSLTKGHDLPGTHGGGNLLSEALVAGCTPWRRTKKQREAITEQMIRLLPFLSAGWIDAWGDYGGRYWLSLTTEGRAAHEAGCPADPCPDVRLDEAASTLYQQTYASYTTELDGLAPRQGAPVICPHPVGINWGGYPADV